MKTNQIMIRPMGEFEVTQRTKDAFFNATDLLKQWNQLKGMKKEVNDYFDLSSTKEFIYTIMERENYDTGNYPYHKSRANKGDNAGTWMHPLLFIDFAMWINPSFKYDVLKFVYDEMIKFRNLSGDAYPTMCKAVKSILPEDIFREKIQDLARSLNIIVYGKHESEMRNKIADESKLRELYELEMNIAQWINLGIVNNYQSLKEDESHRAKMLIGENQLLIKVKGRNTKEGKTPDKVWMNPLLFIKFAMWINPAFEVKVLRFVYDEMIRYRNDAGDAYKELGSAVQKIVPKEFMPKAMQKVGEALNWVVFNSHEKMLRNKQGDESKQRELWQLEKKVADLINEGFITNFDNLISYLRKQYSKRNYPAVFQLQQENTNFIHYK